MVWPTLKFSKPQNSDQDKKNPDNSKILYHYINNNQNTSNATLLLQIPQNEYKT